MTKYEVIKELQGCGIFDEAIRKGIISTTIPAHLVVYETYKERRQDGYGKMDSYSYASVECQFSEDHVYRVVRDFDS